LRERLLAMEMDFEINAEAIKKIAEAGFDPAFGARPLKRAIQSEIENPLAKKILAGDFHAKDKVVVGFSKEKFTFTKA